MSKRCLIVDDVVVSRFTSRAFAEELGYEVVEAESGETCLQELDKDRFSVVLLDWHLRRESGLDLIKSIRKSALNASVPIVLCTGVEQNETGKTAAIAQEAGANGFVMKPLSLESLRATLKSAVVG